MKSGKKTHGIIQGKVRIVGNTQSQRKQAMKTHRMKKKADQFQKKTRFTKARRSNLNGDERIETMKKKWKKIISRGKRPTWEDIQAREQHNLTVIDDATCVASLYPPLTWIQKSNYSVRNVEKI